MIGGAPQRLPEGKIGQDDCLISPSSQRLVRPKVPVRGLTAANVWARQMPEAVSEIREAPLKAPVKYFLIHLSFCRVESALSYSGFLLRMFFIPANFDDRPSVPLAYWTKKVMHLFVL